MLRTSSLTLLLLATALPAADSAYLVPVMPGVVVKPIASSGDLLPAGVAGTGAVAGGSKAVVGILDGLGAWDNGDGTFTLVANHELGSTKGAVHAHGAAGSFVSRWTINTSTLKVVTHADQITSVFTHSGGVWSENNGGLGTPVAIDRLCSGDLPASTAFYDETSGKGLNPSVGRFFMSGEESTNGRAFAHAVHGANIGDSIVLPHFGRAAWENLVACPAEQETTVVIGLDDTTPGQMYVYVGDKQTLAGGTAEDWARAAGLIDGELFTIVANGQLNEQRTGETGFVGVGAGKGTALRFGLSRVAAPATVAGWTTAAPMEAATTTLGGTYFLRPEDGAWDPLLPDTFYFVTTDGFDTVKNGGTGAATATVGRSRLWKLVFDDIADPANGGTITMLIDGSEDPGPQMMDNVGVDRFGRILIQEDPGNQQHSAAIWVYDSNLGTLRKVAKHDPSRFGDRGYGSAGVDGAQTVSVAPWNGDTTSGAAVAGRSDEESSGIIDVQDLLGPGWFLAGVQMHSSTDMSQTLEVERGQLVAMYVPYTLAAGGTYQAGNLTNITYDTTASLGTKTILPVRDGGLGSALAPVAGQPGQFWCLSDRGPNANHPTLGSSTKVFPKPAFAPNLRRVKLNGDGTMTVLEKIELKRNDGVTMLTGKPLPSTSPGWTGETGFEVDAAGAILATALEDPSGFDSEGLVAHPDGTFWISDEYGPFIGHFSANGSEIERFSPYAAGAVSGLKLPSVLRNREPNRGMEGLTLTPDQCHCSNMHGKYRQLANIGFLRVANRPSRFACARRAAEVAA